MASSPIGVPWRTTMDEWPRSRELLALARQSLAGGVNSNVRLSSPPTPLFFTHAAGALLHDVDGHTYIDYALGQGPMILGHSHPAILEAVTAAMATGQLFAGQHELEITVAQHLVRLIPCAELCRFNVSGTEAVQAALRLARAVTGRTLIVRFEGHYHGWLDNVLVSVAPPLERAGPRAVPHAVAGTAGQSPAVLGECLVLPWNDLALVEALFAEHGSEIAAVISEPVMCNTGVIPPAPGYLAGLRRICDSHGAVLILDEVITGFRLGLRGAQGNFGVTADLATFGKAMAGGLPNAAIVGKRALMQRFAHDVNHSGTFNANVLAMAASAAALRELERDDGAVYRVLDERGTALMAGIRTLAAQHGLPVLVQGFPAVFHVAFTELPAIRDYRDYVTGCDRERYRRFAVALLRRGVRVIERGIWYLSAAHTPNHIDQTLAAVEEALLEVFAGPTP
jgi:glutamate-1-semialdehyde 2,1-aminomutase